MYVVKYKQLVVLGIIPWNNQYITDVLRSRYRVVVDIPFDEPEESEFPFLVNEHITIYRAEEDRPTQINPMVEYYYGPTWDLVDNKMIARYQVLPLEVENAKQNYRDLAAQMRYNREISGTSIEINGAVYRIKTARGERSKYIEKFVTLSGDSTISWKFNEGWVTLTKQQLLSVVNAIDSHIQSAFDFERELVEAIDSSNSLDDLLNIEQLNKKNQG